MERRSKMSIKDGKDYLYLIWKSPQTRRQYIVGQLSKNGQYEFQYTEEVQDAIEVGFTPLISFPNISEIYTSKELFSNFSSRLPDRKRKDMDKILKKYGLEEFDPYQLLKMSGAKLPIDNLQFIDPILEFNNAFEREFYMAGVRYYLGCEGENCEQTVDVTRGDQAFLKKEPENKADSCAVKILNDKEELLGYIPRYYSRAFTRMIDEGRTINCYVTSVDKNKCCSECIMIKVMVG